MKGAFNVKKYNQNHGENVNHNDMIASQYAQIN